MLIAVVSDTHSRYRTVVKVTDELDRRGVNLIIHCGDIENEETIELFRDYETHFVFGNCDSDREGLRRAMQRSGAVFYEDFGTLDLEGVRIAWTHGDNARLLRELEQSGQFDFLFYGHTHCQDARESGTTWVINPGALHRARPKSFMILDLRTRKWEAIEVDG
jgi:putative phosphoesterase